MDSTETVATYLINTLQYDFGRDAVSAHHELGSIHLLTIPMSVVRDMLPEQSDNYTDLNDNDCVVISVMTVKSN